MCYPKSSPGTGPRASSGKKVGDSGAKRDLFSTTNVGSFKHATSLVISLRSTSAKKTAIWLLQEIYADKAGRKLLRKLAREAGYRVFFGFPSRIHQGKVMLCTIVHSSIHAQQRDENTILQRAGRSLSIVVGAGLKAAEQSSRLEVLHQGLIVQNLYLESGSDSNADELEVILRSADKANGVPCVVAGDFNLQKAETASALAAHERLGRWRSAETLFPQEEGAVERNTFHRLETDKRPATSTRIDYVLLNKSLLDTVRWEHKKPYQVVRPEWSQVLKEFHSTLQLVLPLHDWKPKMMAYNVPKAFPFHDGADPDKDKECLNAYSMLWDGVEQQWHQNDIELGAFGEKPQNAEKLVQARALINGQYSLWVQCEEDLLTWKYKDQLRGDSADFKGRAATPSIVEKQVAVPCHRATQEISSGELRRIQRILNRINMLAGDVEKFELGKPRKGKTYFKKSKLTSRWRSLLKPMFELTPKELDLPLGVNVPDDETVEQKHRELPTGADLRKWGAAVQRAFVAELTQFRVNVDEANRQRLASPNYV